MAVLLSLLVVILSLAVSITTTEPDPAQDTIFCASPENSTYMTDETEGNVIKDFTCIATNAYDITWIVNGSEMHGEDRTHQSIFRSTLHYEISVGESIEVFCRANPFDRNLPSVDSETAVISVQACICDNQNLPNVAELGENTTSTTDDCSSVAIPLGISALANVGLVVAIIVLIVLLLRAKKQSSASRRVNNDSGDIVEMDGPRRQHGGANIRRRPGQRQ